MLKFSRFFYTGDCSFVCSFQTKDLNKIGPEISVVEANEKEEDDEAKNTLEVPKVQRSYPYPQPHSSVFIAYSLQYRQHTPGGFIACCRCRRFLTGKRPIQSCFRHFSGQVGDELQHFERFERFFDMRRKYSLFLAVQKESADSSIGAHVTIYVTI